MFFPPSVSSYGLSLDQLIVPLVLVELCMVCLLEFSKCKNKKNIYNRNLTPNVMYSLTDGKMTACSIKDFDLIKYCISTAYHHNLFHSKLESTT